jgi:putative oxidoreductase
MDKLIQVKNQVIDILNPMGDYVALLPIRLLMAYEFWTAGMMKFNGTNWFERFQDNFIFPFNYVPVEISWFMATWSELIGGFCLFFGLFTRFWAMSLVIVSIVAISGVHWPEDWNSLSELWKGYAITNKGFGNYRVPLLFIAMLFPLIFSGAGKISIDNILARKFS